jgi:hypothetical protein
MKYNLIKNTSCDNPILCSHNIMEKLESKLNCKLHADKKNDIVNGSLSIYHSNLEHQITIDFYDKNEEPNSKHATKFNKLSKIPTESDIKKII